MVPSSAKVIRWVGSFRQDLRSFPKESRQRAGAELYRVQLGLQPLDFKPLNTVGAGVYEIRVHTRTAPRLIYVAQFAEAVYVLHVFQKRSQKTPRSELELARRRFAQLIESR